MYWPNNARLAMSIVVNVEEGSELSLRDGDRGPDPVDELGIAIAKPIRNFANESNYRYGIEAGAPRILAALGSRAMPATFTAAALSLERAPALASQIIAADHEVCSHGYRWVHQFRMDEATERQFIADAVRSIEETTGERPHGWLSRYLTTEATSRLLLEAGFTYHMDDYSDDQPFWQSVAGGRLMTLPYALDNNDMKFWVAPALAPSDWLQYAIDTFDRLYREGANARRMMSLGVHLRIIGRPGRIDYFERFLDHVLAHDDVWVARRIDIARFAAEQRDTPQRPALS